MNTSSLRSLFLAMAFILLAAQDGHSQSMQQIEAVARLTGSEDPESLDSQEWEMYSAYLSRPLDLNGSSKARLLSSGLLSTYQVASLEDYRKTSGDILSVSELARVDGFGDEFAHALAPFIVLRSPLLPGEVAVDTMIIRRSLVARTSFKGGDNSWAAKLKTEYSDRAQVSLAGKTSYGDHWFPPSSLSGNFVIFSEKLAGKVVAGDFNARFGQGLCLWSGMSMSGFSSAGSFYRRATGVSPSWSYRPVGGHRGVAADLVIGRFSFSAIGSFPGLMELCSGSDSDVSFLPAANLTWFGRHGQIGATAMWLSNPFGPVTGGLRYQAGGKVSADSRWSFRRFELFGETAVDCYTQSVAFVSGMVLNLNNEWKLPAVLRHYPSDFTSDYCSGVRAWTSTSNENGFAVGLEKRTICFTADLAVKQDNIDDRQYKFLAKVPVQISDLFVLSVRAAEKYRPSVSLPNRTGIRLDLDFSSSGVSALYGESAAAAWKARFRLESVCCSEMSGLSYLEAGRKGERSSIYLRSTFFVVDRWDDRIYSYERDAPGNFTVPAYYGRGIALSAVGSMKRRFKFRGRFATSHLYFRASTTCYPFKKYPKESSSELKFQFSLDI